MNQKEINDNNDKAANLFNKIEKHWITYLAIYTSIIVGTTWIIFTQTRLEPKDDIIMGKNTIIENLKIEINYLKSKIKELTDSNDTASTKINKPRKNTHQIDEEKALTQIKYKNLEISKIYYKSPHGEKFSEITPGTRVKSGGEISFEITLPELGGFLLIYSESTKGELINLFPGTAKAVKAGAYRIPYVFDNPTTEIHTLTAKSNSFDMLSKKKMQTPVYIFDETKGNESIHFYYSHEINRELEQLLITARDTKKNIPKMRGFLKNAKAFNQKLVDKKLLKPGYYSNILKLNFIHE